MSQIIFENVSKSYDANEVVRDINFTFPEKATTAVIGVSGSGKSTLLQLVNGLLKPTRGEVKVFGQEIDYTRLPQMRRKIGYAVQGTGLFPHLTVERNITLLAVLERWSSDRIRARLDELMRLVGLSLELCNHYPHELSGGQQQRVGLCRAMMLNPGIFLLDEAFGALDPITRAEIHEEFLHLQEYEPRTIVMVTHDIREALKLGQYIVVLNAGRIEQAGSVESVMSRPASRFVKDFIHSQLEE